MITKEIVVSKISLFLKHEVSLQELVDWSENVMMEEDVDPADNDLLIEVIAQLGLADVKAFGLLLDDCEKLLFKLGFKLNLEVVEISDKK